MPRPWRITHGVLHLLPSLERSEWVVVAVARCGVGFRPLAPAACLTGAKASAGPRLDFHNHCTVTQLMSTPT